MSIKTATTLLALLLLSTTLWANDTLPAPKKSKLIPHYLKTQFAGNIGLVSIGAGYSLAHAHLLTEALYGYVPASVSKGNRIHTITLKNTYAILKPGAKKHHVTPLIGLTASLETGNNSFVRLPEQFPEDYYVSNAFHFTGFVGVKHRIKLSHCKMFEALEYYYEIGGVATHLWYKILSPEVKWRSVTSSALGINFYLH